MINKKNYYQYNPPVAMFSLADFDSNVANFGFVNTIKEPFRRYGRRMGETIDEGLKEATDNFAKNAQYMTDAQRASAASHLKGLQTASNWAKKYPGRVGAVGIGSNALLVGAVGGAAYGASKIFTRRRRTKNGKVVVEQVRR